MPARFGRVGLLETGIRGNDRTGIGPTSAPPSARMKKSKWERDPERRPNRDIMPRLAEELGRSVSWLEGREAAEGARNWEGSAPAGQDGEIDLELLTETVASAMRALVRHYGVDIPRHRIEDAADAADAAVTAYLTYQRIEKDDAA